MRKLGYAFLVIGVILLLVSAGVYIKNDQEAKHAGEVAEVNLVELKEIIKHVQESNAALETTEEALNPIITEDDLEEMAGLKPKPEPETKEEMKSFNVNGYDYIGYIIMPDVHKELPILRDIDPWENMKVSPCLYYGDLFDNNLIIAGHSYEQFFRFLYDVKEGDELIFIDWSGKAHRYFAAVVDIISPDGGKELKNSPYPLTLFTCTEGGVARCVVRYAHAE